MTDDERKVLTSVLLSEIGTVQKYNLLVNELQGEIVRLRLLPEERVAIEQAASFLEGSGWSGATLRSILNRLAPTAE